MPLLCRMPWAPCNGTTSTPSKLAVTLPSNHSTLQWHPAMALSNGTTSTPPKFPPTIAHYNGTLRWHPAMAPRPPSPKLVVKPPLHPHYNGNVQWHPAMAPRPLHPAMAPWCHVQSAPPPLLEVRTPIAIAIWGKMPPPNHSTLQWHPAMAPRPLPQSWSSRSPPTIAHYNGTLQWHPAMAPRPHCNGTLRWHPAMASRPLHPAMAPWCHVQSAKVVRRPPPVVEVRTPIAIAIWGKNIAIWGPNPWQVLQQDSPFPTVPGSKSSRYQVCM